MVAAAEDLITAGRDARQPHSGRDGLGARLEEANLLKPGNLFAQRFGELFFGDWGQRADHSGGDRGLGGTIDLGMSVSQRHGAKCHDVVDVLAAVLVPHAAARRPHHAGRRPEQRLGPLATGRREARNAPVVHRIWSPR